MINKITNEITAYRSESTELFEGHSFSLYRLIRRISLYMNEIYPTGKTDSQGNYKYWFNIIRPRVNAEIKNIDFDTKDISLYSEADNDAARILISDARLKEWLHETGQAEKLNTAIERGAEWGNVVWKKVKGDYRIMNFTDFMVLNQTAETLASSDVIEQAVMSAIDLRKEAGLWKNTENLIETKHPVSKKSCTEFFVYERNGEVSEKDYIEALDMMIYGSTTGAGSDNKYMLAKIIVGGIEKDKPNQVLYCEEIGEKPYKEYHRTSYTGRWFRVGLYETLMDIQTRANEIGNQIARGLEWASKTIFASSDRVIAQNILTDLQNGDIIKSSDLKQVETRMNGLDQLIADWNRLMQMADLLANSFEVVTGESLPGNTPFRLGAMINQNANKLFDFIREKLGIALQPVIEEWILPDLLKDLKARDVLRLTQDSGVLIRYYELLINNWYINNLLSMPPHGDDVSQTIKEQKLQELMKNDEVRVRLEKDMWNDFYPRVRVEITGENRNLAGDLETLQTFIGLEADPVRRTALIEIAMKKKNIDIAALPKSPPMPTTDPNATADVPKGQQKKKPGVLDSLLSQQSGALRK